MKKTTMDKIDLNFNIPGPDIVHTVELLIKARKDYYNTGRSSFTDAEYDALEDKLRSIVPDHPFFETVGHPPSSTWITAIHNIFMGSLDKVNNEEDLIKWAVKFKEILFVLQFKLDGLSLSIDYEKSKFIRAITRGDGFEGEDISDNVMLMRGFRKLLKKSFSGSIRSEIVLLKEDFKEINSTLSDDEKYSNPRNAAAGISRRLDGRFCKYLQIICYDLNEPINEDEKIEKLKELGLITVEQTIGLLDVIVKQFQSIKNLRPLLPYDIDGTVIKVNSFKLQQEYGISRNKPKAQIAWKFDSPGAITIFIEETWDVGRTGVLTPLAHLVPVNIEGSTISKATLHNIAEIKRLGIGRGDTVMVIKAGDIIPKVLSVLEHKDDLIKIPKTCPSCGTILLNDEIKLKCPNDSCLRKMFFRILNWIQVIKIDSFGESLVNELSKIGKLTKISDLYKLTEDDISSIPGWGKVSAEEILDNINHTRVLSQEIFISAIGIPGISERTSEELLGAFKTIDNLLQKNVEDIKTLKGFSDISANNIIQGLNKYKDEIEELLKIITISSGEENNGKLSGLSFCFTGIMEKPRSYYQDIVKNFGGKNSSKVIKDLSYLVCNEDKGSNKSKKATQYGVKIITEKDFLNMVGEVASESLVQPKVENYSLFE